MKKLFAKTKYLALIGLAMALALVVLLCSFFISRHTNARERAELALKTGDYSEAAGMYLELGDEIMHSHCLRLIDEQNYLQARQNLQFGSYEKAMGALSTLGDYKDSKNLLDACRYLWANELCRQGKYYKALNLARELSDYPGLEALMLQCSEGLSATATDFARRGNYKEALELWRSLDQYENAENLAFRATRMLQWLERPEDERLLHPDRHFESSYYENVYLSEDAYFVISESISPDCRFFIYYPGGTDEEINIDFVTYYLMNPAEDCIAVFLRRNGLKNMEEKNSQALALLDEVAAECGVFPTKIMVCGSSMGAYPAMHSPRLSMEELGLRVDCVLSLDAGADWVTDHTLKSWQCEQTLPCGTEFYLFESPWVGINRAAIMRMVEAGLDVISVGCRYDEHVRITLDAMGMGVIHWALGDRSQPCPLDIYDFQRHTGQ